MFIKTGEQFPCGTLMVLCEACGKEVARMTSQEVASLSMQNERVFCFDCEGVWSDMIPPQLTPDKTVNVIVCNLQKHPVTLLFYTTDGDVSARNIKAKSGSTCLSSNTNLHETVKKPEKGVSETGVSER